MAQIGEMGIQTPSGVEKIPVFDEGDSGSNVFEVLKVSTPSGIGFMPAIDTADGPAFPYLKVQTANNGILALHNAATLASLTVTSTLNSETVILYGYEDTTGDGTADNTDSWTLTGGTEELDVGAFDLSTGNDFWVEAETEDDGTITTAVEQIDVELNY